MNDTELLIIQFSLPAGFGYVFNELNVNIVVDTATDWENRGVWRLDQTSSANADFNYRIPLDFLTVIANGVDAQVRTTKINNTLTRTPIVPRASGATQQIIFSNVAAAVQAAGVVNALCSFWEFDLQQMQYFPAHTALSTTTR